MAKHILLYFRDVPKSERDALAKKSHALPGGSYPIANEEDLHNAAILAKSGHGDVAAAKALIARRAKELGVKNPLDSVKATDLYIFSAPVMSEDDMDQDPAIPGHDDDYAQDIAQGTMDDTDDADVECHADMQDHAHTINGTTTSGMHSHVNNDLTPIPMVPSASSETAATVVSAMSPGSNFLSYLYKNIQSHVNDRGNMSMDDFNAYVRKARAYAGGSAPHKPAVVADNQGAQKPYETMGPMGTEYTMSISLVTENDADFNISGDVADLCASKFSDNDPSHPGDPDARLFMPVAFTELKEWIPYLPKPGNHKHPTWGNVSITPERNQHFVQNFKDGVYQTELPIDAEHETKLSGALAWVKDMRMAEDQSVEARVEYTDRGRAMLKGDAYKYFSPEFYNYWTPPESFGKVIHKDVAVGGAFTTRPFFKESALRSLIANERGIQVLARETPTPIERNKTMPEETVTIDPAKFTEMQNELASFKEALDAAKAEAVKATERSAALELVNRTQRFNEIVNGSVENDEPRWFGEVDSHIKHLEAMTQAFGEDSDEVKFYIETQKATANALRTSSLFTERGRTGAGASNANPTARFSEMVKAKTIELGGPDHELDAMNIVASEHPDLYKDHMRSSVTRARD